MKGYGRVVVYYFSGTGNAYNVASWIRRRAQTDGRECEIIDITGLESRRSEKPAHGTLTVFVSPVHGFNYPPVMLGFLARFPRGRGDVALLNTRAGMKIGNWVTPGVSGVSMYLAALLLRFKGYSLRGMVPVDMPSNWISLHPGLNERTVRFIHQKMTVKVDKYTRRLLEGKRAFPALAEIVVDLAVSPVSVLYYCFGRFMLAKTNYASSQCNRCGSCIRECPVNAIVTVSGRPFWTMRCESCMHCMSYCPQQAIQAAHGFFAVNMALFYLGVLYLVQRYLAAVVPKIHPLLYEWPVQFLMFMILLAGSYRLMHFLLRFRCFAKIMAFTSLTHYRFWGRRYRALEPDKPA